MNHKILTLAAAMLLALPLTAQDYGITVGETPITAQNAADVECDNLLSGTISYDPDSRTLTLDNVICDAQIDCTGHNADLTVRLIGDNICGGWFMAAFNRTTTIQSDGTGRLEADQVSIQGMPGDAILHLKRCTLRSNLHRRNRFGISGTNNETLIIEEATIESDGLQGSVGNFGTIGLIRTRLAEPMGAMLDGGMVTMLGRPICRRVVIRP